MIQIYCGDGKGKTTAAIGLAGGILFLLAMDRLIPHLHLGSQEPEGVRAHLSRTAMLVLADALDESRKGKITGVRLRLEPDRLVVTASGREEPILERWAFGECAPFFADVFGIQPVLVYKSELLS